MLPYIGLKTRHNGLCSTNPGCHLSLGKSGSSPGFQNLVKKFEVLSECVILATHVGARERPVFERFKSIPHSLFTFFMRFRAISSSFLESSQTS
jgi:hypothetical protein